MVFILLLMADISLICLNRNGLFLTGWHYLLKSFRELIIDMKEKIISGRVVKIYWIEILEEKLCYVSLEPFTIAILPRCEFLEAKPERGKEMSI